MENQMIDKQSVVEDIKQIIIKSLDLTLAPEEIEGKSLSEELGINSIDSLEILVWIENHFQIEIDDEDLSVDLVNSLDYLSDYILDRKAQQI